MQLYPDWRKTNQCTLLNTPVNPPILYRYGTGAHQRGFFVKLGFTRRSFRPMLTPWLGAWSLSLGASDPSHDIETCLEPSRGRHGVILFSFEAEESAMGKPPFRPGYTIRPCQPPPPDHRLFVRQFIPPASHTTLMVAIHQHVLGYNVHFLDGRTVPCTGTPSTCEGCRRLIAPRWEGYLGIVLLPSRSVRVLKITVGAWRNCSAMSSRQGQLRGLEVQATRMGQRNNSPLRLRLAQGRPDIELPPPWPMQETLARLWGYSEIGDIEQAETVDLAEVDAAILREKGGRR